MCSSCIENPKLVRAEADEYRRAIVALAAEATSTGKRKTMDKVDIARIVGPALERGNALHRRARGLER